MLFIYFMRVIILSLFYAFKSILKGVIETMTRAVQMNENAYKRRDKK